MVALPTPVIIHSFLSDVSMARHAIFDVARKDCLAVKSFQLVTSRWN